MPELDAFLQAAKQKGASDEFLVALLRERGWPETDIYQALGRHYAEATGVPVPAARGRMESAREAFFHLLAFSTLATWLIATGSLWFELIDIWFPNPARASAAVWAWRRVAWQMASIIVAFPVFVAATRSILHELEQNPEKAISPVRRWLTNIALLVAALVTIGDLMAFVAGFLQGEMTTRFALQCLTIFVLAGAVFLYYGRSSTRVWNRSFASVSAGAIAVTLALGFLQTGSPAALRLRAEDRKRVQDLHQIATRIHAHYDTAKSLPPSLASLQSAGNMGLPEVDPYTRQPYTYKPGNGSIYELCASFTTATETPAGQPAVAWSHPSGPACLTLDASKRPDYPAGPN